MITPHEISLIKKSWSIFRDIEPSVVADVFYTRLFLENPELRRMFPSSMDEQYKKLIEMLNIVVARLERVDELTGDIAAMARRHKDYGVRPEHYNMVGRALLWTLQRGLNGEWTQEVKSAWINCYATLSGTMISATRESDH
jgi:hemoglobin-like flavoprotein